jgi:DNA invertase Pin-like site-specific DNA recombinase
VKRGNFGGMENNLSPAPRRVVLYFRVSTQRQGQSGLGLEAQRSAVACCIEGAEVLGEFVEVASGRKSYRPSRKKNGHRRELAAALELCKKEGAELVIAKLDRLARCTRTILELRDAGVKFYACDLPEFNTLTLTIFAAFAQYEAERASERTKLALAEKRKKVEEWRKSPLTPELRALGNEGNKEEAALDENNKRATAYLFALRGAKYTLAQKAELLNEAGFRTRRQKTFTPTAVLRLERRAAGL